MPDEIARSERQLGAILRRIRKLKGLSQSELGALIDMRQETVSRLETGAPALQVRTLMAVLAALDQELVVRPRTKAEARDFADIF
ncbi:MAG: XRE family transcriptional regulator [Alphaproteobacteria bacterium]|nr:helix-turn-helix transcriptional regulator [Alphaproteobacteria bacterium]TAD88232.1 MAG: XRE family transcriptional regulator [Alphaproteobacteria bacterium]